MNTGDLVRLNGDVGKVVSIRPSDELETVHDVPVGGRLFSITGPAYEIVKVRFMNGTIVETRKSDLSLMREHRAAA